MSGPNIFGVYLARFPFLETNVDKIRPVIVISNPHSQYGVVAIVPVSSQKTRETVDSVLNSWKSAGLMKASIARVHRLTTVLQSDLVAELGQLNNSDIDALKTSLRTFLGL